MSKTKCKCPSCGTKFKIKAKKTKAPVATLLPTIRQQIAERAAPKVRKFITSSDKGKLRQALWDAGFKAQATNGTIFNDVSKHNGKRRLKLWNGNGLVTAPAKQRQLFVDNVAKQFGARLIEQDKYGDGQYASYIVRLTD